MNDSCCAYRPTVPGPLPHVPVDALLGIVCYDDAVRVAIQTEADKRGVKIKIVAQPKWYLLMIRFTQGNLLEADVEALVNTVNTVGVMGKGVALMFKEAFPQNFKAYEAACRRKELRVGKMFVTKREELIGPEWIINFPTKAHWRFPSRLDWISDGLDDLRRVIVNNRIHSIALPPLGTGNGGLEWEHVRSLIEDQLARLSNVDIFVFEPTGKYQNVAKPLFSV